MALRKSALIGKDRSTARLFILIYSFLLTLALVVAAPWWLGRMLTSNRYREGFAQRLGAVPPALRHTGASGKIIWLHAVSVGELFAAARLVQELRESLPDWTVVISTTTATGQKIARERFGTDAVFYLPLDFAFAVRPYLRALQPRLLILMESELWPRLLVECERAAIPVAVVNARISDRSFPRYLRLRALWRPLLRKVHLFLAQGEETAERLRQIGVPAERVQVSGNLKYDLLAPPPNAVAARLEFLLRDRKLIVAGSTLSGEERMLLAAWTEIVQAKPETVLVLAPRHPQRFPEVAELLLAGDFDWLRASSQEFRHERGTLPGGAILLLDTLGDLASVYELASVAFIGGSLVPSGGHNPLEAARFGVPVLMGPSCQNFREIVDGMKAASAMRIAQENNLTQDLLSLLEDDHGMGQRGRAFFRSNAGATARTLEALLALLPETGA
jgi:3-deoxy-D-manno-octulosonic-acid transferase